MFPMETFMLVVFPVFLTRWGNSSHALPYLARNYVITTPARVWASLAIWVSMKSIFFISMEFDITFLLPSYSFLSLHATLHLLMQEFEILQLEDFNADEDAKLMFLPSTKYQAPWFKNLPRSIISSIILYSLTVISLEFSFLLLCHAPWLLEDSKLYRLDKF